MRIYEASIAYNLVQLVDVPALITPDKIAEYLHDGYAKNPRQESLWVICLDRKNKPISRTMVTLGTLTCALAHPREVFKIAILASAAAIVVSHNHPSGDPAPSSADIQAHPPAAGGRKDHRYQPHRPRHRRHDGGRSTSHGILLVPKCGLL